MDIVGVTRLKDGKEVDEFVVGHEEHNYWYKGRPPLTPGCRECWHAFYFAQTAIAGGDLKDHVNQLESAIRHVSEQVEKGTFDFKPKLEEMKIEHED